uniref:Uncharacterized protein n=1 Tax=Arundo donax TaxID=35708 RepID=A0A0A9GW11_ARUDO
MLNFFLACSGE